MLTNLVHPIEMPPLGASIEPISSPANWQGRD